MSFRAVVRCDAGSREALPSMPTLRPSTSSSALNCIVPSSACDSVALSMLRLPTAPSAGSTTSTLSSSIERVEPTSNASNIRRTASNTTDETWSGSISPSEFSSAAVQSAAARSECLRIDAGVADPGAAELDTAGKQRQGADAEIDLAGLEHGRSAVPGPEADVGNLDGKQLRAIDRYARRSQHSVDLEAGQPLDRGLGLVTQLLGADTGRGEHVDTNPGDERQRGEQRRRGGSATQQPARGAAALGEMVLAGGRRKRSQRIYLIAAKPDLFVF